MKSVPGPAILVIDNHQTLQHRITNRLAAAGYRVVAAASRDAIEEKISAEQITLLAIHCIQAWEEILAVIKSVKKDVRCKNVLILCYSGKYTQSSHMVAAFEAGVDEYIVHPWNWRVFLARVKALMRRSTFRTSRSSWLSYREIRVNPETRAVQAARKDISLTPKEFGLLCLLLEKQGKVLDRSFLMESVWEYSYFGTTRTVDKHVENLRNKLGRTGQYIKTVERVGYKLE